MSASVLVVDDDRGMTEMLTAGLEKIGLSVEARESGDEAFALLDGRDFDVVVTDLNMRGINALELSGGSSRTAPTSPSSSSPPSEASTPRSPPFARAPTTSSPSPSISTSWGSRCGGRSSTAPSATSSTRSGDRIRFRGRAPPSRRSTR